LNQNNTDLQNNPTLNTTTSITPQTQNKENESMETAYIDNSQLIRNLDAVNYTLKPALYPSG
ncbi:hypothetical protein, partial [Helicobacter bilis]